MPSGCPLTPFKFYNVIIKLERWYYKSYGVPLLSKGLPPLLPLHAVTDGCVPVLHVTVQLVSSSSLRRPTATSSSHLWHSFTCLFGQRLCDIRHTWPAQSHFSFGSFGQKLVYYYIEFSQWFRNHKPFVFQLEFGDVWRLLQILLLSAYLPENLINSRAEAVARSFYTLFEYTS